jgi:hypothetical protein
MTLFRGHVEKGVIVLDEEHELPEGAPVTVSVATTAPVTTVSGQSPSLYERLESIIGKAQNLPADASANKRHYLYGHPKTL